MSFAMRIPIYICAHKIDITQTVLHCTHVKEICGYFEETEEAAALDWHILGIVVHSRVQLGEILGLVLPVDLERL